MLQQGISSLGTLSVELVEFDGQTLQGHFVISDDHTLGSVPLASRGWVGEEEVIETKREGLWLAALTGTVKQDNHKMHRMFYHLYQSIIHMISKIKLS